MTDKVYTVDVCLTYIETPQGKPLRLVFNPALAESMVDTIVNQMNSHLQGLPGFRSVGISYIEGNKAHVDLRPSVFISLRDDIKGILQEINAHYPSAKVEEVYLLSTLKSLIAEELGISEDKVF